MGSAADEACCRFKLIEAFQAISAWMDAHYLRLNSAKTVFVPFSRQPDIMDSCAPIRLGDVDVVPSGEARNLGVVFDSGLTFQPHIAYVRKTAFFQLRRLQLCKRFVPRGLLVCLIHAFITSRLDFCNSLFFGLPENRMHRLQSVQNAAAKFLTGRRKYDSATEALDQLHWLPVRKRVLYKISCIGYHLHLRTPFYPQYFLHIIRLRPPSMGVQTRLSLQPLLLSDFAPRLKTVGHRSVSYSTVKIYNSLPVDLRTSISFTSFKNNLKTYLYTV